MCRRGVILAVSVLVTSWPVVIHSVPVDTGREDRRCSHALL
jgi:hypothetical protein